ncbi:MULTISPECIES: hypothetical protein [unclassified Breznakia]|uniref:rolling circle replication-associated protein n=1 Tax=unclassified Breznakia TaxID=2623764 RepID=UPI0024749DA7|nr:MULTISPECIES: hypothetical protein [unclassified Breznakia]MDH6367037.1 hypothetical protein [Breznakia sp. PH1-1]MDH6404191.1 hypothetical protein [Breznakia sp. PF1-11]MDH6411924.1 hypothetical protein [Breznakia sp. PFB1-11]MDH6414179.1 hypothetical protein [Breznakia sp. PFB1-14]MDH6415998.1 hypothetical protein [Breznakia sp. PFB1-4]
MIFNNKIIRSGNSTEIYRYAKYQDIQENGVITHDNKHAKSENLKSSKVNVTNCNEKTGAENRFSIRNPLSIQRSKRTVRRLIECNINQHNETDKFVTLTFDSRKCKNKTGINRKYVVYAQKEFMRKMSKLYGDFKYISVIEIGENGTKRLHIHLLFFGLKYIHHTKLKRIWNKGSVDIRKLNDVGYNASAISAYMTKYFTKTLSDYSFFERGKKCYSCSRGLKKPEVIYTCDKEVMYSYLENAGDKQFQVECDNEYVGKFKYMKFSKPLEDK